MSSSGRRGTVGGGQPVEQPCLGQQGESVGHPPVLGHLTVPVPHAQAIYRALAAPGVYRELVEESGWTPGDFEHWVADTLQRDLMTPDDAGPGLS